jgi:hypothetical protein
MLDLDPLAQPGAALGGLLGGAELDQQPLIGVDLHAAAAWAGGALVPQRADPAGLGGELDLTARLERHHLPVGAGQDALVEVEGERGLGEAAPAGADRERLTVDGQVGLAVADEAACSASTPPAATFW